MAEEGEDDGANEGNADTYADAAKLAIAVLVPLPDSPLASPISVLAITS